MRPPLATTTTSPRGGIGDHLGHDVRPRFIAGIAFEFDRAGNPVEPRTAPLRAEMSNAGGQSQLVEGIADDGGIQPS